MLEIIIGAVSVLKILFPNDMLFAPWLTNSSYSISSIPPSGPIITPKFKLSFFKSLSFFISSLKLLICSFSYAINTISYFSLKLQTLFIFITLLILVMASLPLCS